LQEVSSGTNSLCKDLSPWGSLCSFLFTILFMCHLSCVIVCVEISIKLPRAQEQSAMISCSHAVHCPDERSSGKAGLPHMNGKQQRDIFATADSETQAEAIYHSGSGRVSSSLHGTARDRLTRRDTMSSQGCKASSREQTFAGLCPDLTNDFSAVSVGSICGT
jgi:hypothetical protein